MDIKVSIITTVKNGSKYILETLESIKNQTYQEFEHIVVDDGSTDNTVQLLKDFQERNPNYKLFVFQPGNLGRGKALNFAVSKANFDWVAIIDADDIWHPQKLEAQANILKRNTDISVLATKTGLFSDSIVFNRFEEFTENRIAIKSLLYVNSVSHSSVVIKKDCAWYNESRTSQFDYELWLRLGFDKKKKIAIIKEELNFHRIHLNQSFESKGGNKYVLNGYKLMSQYAIKNLLLLPWAINTIKLIFKLLLPRKIKMMFRYDN